MMMMLSAPDYYEVTRRIVSGDCFERVIMAKLARRLAENVEGDFYVDDTCIDCDACRQIAPATFCDAGEQSVVYHQPEAEEETRLALMALVACPTASIGVMKKHDMRKGIDA